MKLICTPAKHPNSSGPADLRLELFKYSSLKGRGRIGAAIERAIDHAGLTPTARAWDLLSVALAIISADLAEPRNQSADGWTRRFELHVAVSDPAFWTTQRPTMEFLFSFLTTDTWRIEFLGKGFLPLPPTKAVLPPEDSVVLLSGGLDSLVGAIDLIANGKRPLAVSQVVRGDAEKQKQFAARIGSGLRHLPLNHNADLPHPESPPSQRARSIAFLAYGVLVATTLAQHQRGSTIPLYVCENGFIGINPPLTGARIGSLSTRTTHPTFLALFQKLLDAAELRVRVETPYRLCTKGEMLLGCKDQMFLKKLAPSSTSCGRFNHFANTHCGRCVPCLIRRAAFKRWGERDTTQYVYKNLAVDSTMRFDDIRSAMMAILQAKQDGLERWLSVTLRSPMIADSAGLEGVVQRGLDELEAFLVGCGVK